MAIEYPLKIARHRDCEVATRLILNPLPTIDPLRPARDSHRAEHTHNASVVAESQRDGRSSGSESLVRLLQEVEDHRVGNLADKAATDARITALDIVADVHRLPPQIGLLGREHLREIDRSGRRTAKRADVAEQMHHKESAIGDGRHKVGGKERVQQSAVVDESVAVVVPLRHPLGIRPAVQIDAVGKRRAAHTRERIEYRHIRETRVEQLHLDGWRTTHEFVGKAVHTEQTARNGRRGSRNDGLVAEYRRMVLDHTPRNLVLLLQTELGEVARASCTYLAHLQQLVVRVTSQRSQRTLFGCSLEDRHHRLELRVELDKARAVTTVVRDIDRLVALRYGRRLGDFGRVGTIDTGGKRQIGEDSLARGLGCGARHDGDCCQNGQYAFHLFGYLFYLFAFIGRYLLSVGRSAWVTFPPPFQRTVFAV